MFWYWLYFPLMGRMSEAKLAVFVETWWVSFSLVCSLSTPLIEPDHIPHACKYLISRKWNPIPQSFNNSRLFFHNKHFIKNVNNLTEWDPISYYYIECKFWVQTVRVTFNKINRWAFQEYVDHSNEFGPYRRKDVCIHDQILLRCWYYSTTSVW